MTGSAGSGAVFLLTDYGHADEFAGIVRAVVARDAPGAVIIDLTHEIPAFDVRAGALTLVRCIGHLGPGVVVAIVDPGVGTDRRALAVEVEGDAADGDGPRYLLGPDNGLLPWAVDALGGPRGAVALPSGGTFDGRDVFAPAAAALWRGEPARGLGTPFDPGQLIRLADPHLALSDSVIEAEVLWVDRFGNVQLSASAADGHRAGFERGQWVDVGVGARASWAPAPFVSSFAALEDTGAAGGEGLGLLVDANGHLAVVCARRSAAAVLGVQPGGFVTLRRGR